MSGRDRRINRGNHAAGASLPRRLVATLAAVTLLLVGTVVPEPASASHFVPLTVTITSVSVLDDGLDGTGRGDADLYAGFEIATPENRDCGTFADHGHGQTELRPTDWVCSTLVEITNHGLPQFEPVSLQIWDHDDCSTPFCSNTGTFESNDDQADASPGTNDTLSLMVDLATGRWTSTGGSTDVDWPRNCAQGTGETAVRICFDISIDSTGGDADNDGLLDGWERNGYNADGDATIDLDMPAIGTHPLRKDLLLELDCLTAGDHSHCPVQAVVQDSVQAFANAPVVNLDGSRGIQLHVDVGTMFSQALNTDTAVARTEAPIGNVQGSVGNFGSTSQIGEAGNTIVDFDGAAGNPGTNIATIKAAGTNFDSKRALVMRYGLFGHQTNERARVNDCTSGLAVGDTFLVTLGGLRAPTPPSTVLTPCWTVDANGFSVGSLARQTGTLLHELGHTLGLDHGGNEPTNEKPNYFSVMNYAMTACRVPSVPAVGVSGGCDFSRVQMPDLVETALDECAGFGLALGPINWNFDGNFSGPFLDGASCAPATPNIMFNINRDTSNDMDGDGSQSGTEPPRLTTLTGYDDWQNLAYRLSANGGGGGASGDVLEVTPEIAAAAEAHLALLVRPAPSVEKSGPTDAEPGDLLSYTLTATNTATPEGHANGPAMATSLTDTKPDGTKAAFTIGTLTAGAEQTRQLTYTVPCDTADQGVLTNHVALTATDVLGTPFSDSDSVETTVHAPVITLAKIGSASVNAGEAITYALTFENAGSGDATDVTIIDRLPAGLYYSTALDLGDGPGPDTAVPNADGSTTLTWDVGDLAAGSGAQTIEYTVRPTLLFVGGETVVNDASLTFENENGCVYEGDTASASTAITVLVPAEDPLTIGYWRTHPDDRLAETLARIQATDQRFDGADGSTPDGSLGAAEVSAVLLPGDGARLVEQQLLATYLNLATRRINAATEIDSRLVRSLGLENVRDAVTYAHDTLELPFTKPNRSRYSDATEVLDQVNNNKSEVY